MKKFGFTLSEILLALAIIGVVSAITAPMVSGLFPDKDKVKVLKTYKLITDITNEMLEDRSLYFPETNCRGLGCNSSSPLRTEYAQFKYSGNQKYPRLLSEHLELNTDFASVTGGWNFTTQDGITWFIASPVVVGNNTNESPRSISHNISVDLDPSDNTNCSYANTCLTPDTYVFRVDTNGRVTGVDELTKAYLANPYKVNDKKKDYATAKSNLKSN